MADTSMSGDAGGIFYPVLPIVPKCSYCAAIRFGLFGSLATGFICSGWKGVAYGTLVAIVISACVWIEARRGKGVTQLTENLGDNDLK
jgi:hypothetical protein